jgi:hypothetical protein
MATPPDIGKRGHLTLAKDPQFRLCRHRLPSRPRSVGYGRRGQIVEACPRPRRSPVARRSSNAANALARTFVLQGTGCRDGPVGAVTQRVRNKRRLARADDATDAPCGTNLNGPCRDVSGWRASDPTQTSSGGRATRGRARAPGACQPPDAEIRWSSGKEARKWLARDDL